MGLFKFVDLFGNQIDVFMDKIENGIDKFGNYLDNLIGKQIFIGQQQILSELTTQRSTISKQSETELKAYITKESQPENVTQFVDSEFDNELEESLNYLGIQLPTTNINTHDVDDYVMLGGDEYDEDEEDENQDFLNLILGE